MKTKLCVKCNTIKQLNEFYKTHTECKTCFLKRSKIYKEENKKEITLKKLNYSRTIPGIITLIYATQKRSSKRRNHPLPAYTKLELKDWLFSNNIINLYNNWVKHDYNSKYKPSIDRLDDYKPYTLDNIRLVTWEENNKKAYRDVRNGVNNKKSKGVSQYTLKNVFINKYPSMTIAAKITGSTKSKISKACKSRKPSDNYIWKLTENNS